MTNTQIGELAEKYEVGSRGPGYISNGDAWDPGGDSYGSYQLATKVGTLQGYLKRIDLKYVSEFKGYFIKSAAFNAKWKEIAARDPEGFKESQFEYVRDISYTACRKYADKLGYKDTLAINSALFSISNQHGRWKRVLDMADISPKESESVQIRKLYAARKVYIQSLSTMTQKLKNSLIASRCEQELVDALKLMNHIAPDSRDDKDTSDTNTKDNGNVSPEASQTPLKNNPLLDTILQGLKDLFGGK